jgi:hypothetical protein
LPQMGQHSGASTPSEELTNVRRNAHFSHTA